MFIVGFLGLTFLITSGCILYFKQMGESEEEKPNYTILRKLGFTEENLQRGIRFKQLFNFGIPLAVGLSHSYFAVQSGWFLFGTELWTPMIIVMLLYAALYSIFGILSAVYYKKVIKSRLINFNARFPKNWAFPHWCKAIHLQSIFSNLSIARPFLLHILFRTDK